MCPGSITAPGIHMWVAFVGGSRPCSEGYSPGSPVFLPPQKPTLQVSSDLMHVHFITDRLASLHAHLLFAGSTWHKSHPGLLRGEYVQDTNNVRLFLLVFFVWYKTTQLAWERLILVEFLRKMLNTMFFFCSFHCVVESLLRATRCVHNKRNLKKTINCEKILQAI